MTPTSLGTARRSGSGSVTDSGRPCPHCPHCPDHPEHPDHAAGQGAPTRAPLPEESQDGELGQATRAQGAESRQGTIPPTKYPATTDPDIVTTVARVKSGDVDAFAALYDRYSAVVYRYVYYRVGTSNVAEDLTSETFLRALLRITSFTWQGKDFAAWLVTIARNLVADHFKSGRFRLEVCTADMVDADRVEDGPEQATLDSITKTALLEAVRRLDSEQRQCVVLRFLQGLSVAETATAMGKNPGAVKALQYRAVRSLARILPYGIR